MRPIKFRCWDNGKMYYQVQAGGFDETVPSIYVERDGIAEWVNASPGYKVMQFTGLLDKNAKEIYEGDILLLCRDIFVVKGNYIGTVKWDKNGFGFDELKWVGEYSENVDKWPLLDQFIIYPYTDCYEIIGNIYENPSILETEEINEHLA